MSTESPTIESYDFGGHHGSVALNHRLFTMSTNHSDHIQYCSEQLSGSPESLVSGFK